MSSEKDYDKMTLEELVSKEKQLKSLRITTAVFIGVLIGIAVYAAAHKSFVLPVILLISAFVLGDRNAKNLKSIQAEINRREAGR